MNWRRLLGFCLAPVLAVALPSGCGGATPPAGPVSETEYLALLLDGKKIGHSKVTRTVAEEKVTTSVAMVMTMTRGPVSITVRIVETNFETTRGKPLGFKSVQDLGIMAQTVEGTVDEQGKVHVKTTAAGKTRTRTMDWPEGALMSEGLALLSRKKGLKEGTTYTCKAFMADSLKAVEVRVEVGAKREVDLFGRVVSLREMKTKFLSGISGLESVTYVNDKGGALKTITTAMGMKIVMVSCSKEVALSPNDVTDFLAKLLLASPVPLDGLNRTASVTYRLEPIGEAKLDIPATDDQTVSKAPDGALIVKVSPARPAAGAKFPYKGSDKAALAAMKPARYVQSDDKRIVTLARKAVGDAADAADAVRRIEKFVAGYIHKKNLAVGYATASEVALSRQGDCTEHAVLAAAMCRAVGIPAQVVVGVAYVPRFGGRKHVFGPHAWVRAYIRGKWIGLDATLGQFDAGHIALSAGNGSPEDFFSIVRVLGNFKIAQASLEK